MASPATAVDSQWRHQMTREDRIKVCKHVVGKLLECYPGTPERELGEHTTRVEQRAFTAAASRLDYLRRIAAELTRTQCLAAQGAPFSSVGAAAPSPPPPPTPPQQPPQPPSSPPAPASPTSQLQGSLPGVDAEDRLRVRKYIRDKLTVLYQMLPEEAMAKKAESFEDVAFINSTSRQDYMARIARGLSSVEDTAGGSATAAPPPPPPPPPHHRQQRALQPANASAAIAAAASSPPPGAAGGGATSGLSSRGSTMTGLAENLNWAVIE